MAHQAAAGPQYPQYYDEVVKFRQHGFHKGPKDDICLKFVPGKDELTAVYNTPLTNLLSRKKLPFAVKVTRNYNFVGDSQDGINLKAGSMLMLHFIVRPERVFATNSKRTDVVLPIHAEQLYEVLPIVPGHDDKTFYGTAEVIKSKPLPKRLRIVDAIYSTEPGEAQETGEIIEVSHVETRKGLKVLIGRSSLTRQNFAFSELMKESVYSAMVLDEHLTLSSIVSTFKLPLRVRKVGERNCALLLNEVRKEAQVICTDTQHNRVFSLALTCPVHLDYVDNQGVETVVKATIPPLYPMLNWTWGLMEIGRAPPPLQQQQTPQPLLGVLCHWLNSIEGLKLVSMISDSSSKAKDDEISALKKEIKRLKRQSSQQPRPAIPPRRPTISNSSTYDDVLPTPPPRKPSQLNEELRKKQKEHTVYEVPSQGKLSDESVEGVLKFLDRIGLSAYSENFQEENIDGALLFDLVKDGEEVFITELKMRKLHARKLLVEINKQL